MCAHFCYKMVDCGICLMHCGICEMGVLPEPKMTLSIPGTLKKYVIHENVKNVSKMAAILFRLQCVNHIMLHTYHITATNKLYIQGT